jgi:hypothetical protein
VALVAQANQVDIVFSSLLHGPVFLAKLQN